MGVCEGEACVTKAENTQMIWKVALQSLCAHNCRSMGPKISIVFININKYSNALVQLCGFFFSWIRLKTRDVWDLIGVIKSEMTQVLATLAD